MIYGDVILLQMLNPCEGEQVAYATCTSFFIYSCNKGNMDLLCFLQLGHHHMSELHGKQHVI